MLGTVTVSGVVNVAVIALGDQGEDRSKEYDEGYWDSTGGDMAFFNIGLGWTDVNGYGYPYLSYGPLEYLWTGQDPNYPAPGPPLLVVTWAATDITPPVWVTYLVDQDTGDLVEADVPLHSLGGGPTDKGTLNVSYTLTRPPGINNQPAALDLRADLVH